MYLTSKNRQKCGTILPSFVYITIVFSIVVIATLPIAFSPILVVGRLPFFAIAYPALTPVTIIRIHQVK